MHIAWSTCTPTGQAQCLGGPEGRLMHWCRISFGPESRPQVSEAAKGFFTISGLMLCRWCW